MNLNAGSRLAAAFAFGAGVLCAAESSGDRMLATYLQQETAHISAATWADIKSLEDWTSRRETYREQLFEMVGLLPRPERTDLRATITGKEDHGEFHVEKLHYQSLPGLYATG